MAKKRKIRIGMCTPIMNFDEEHVIMLKEARVNFATIFTDRFPEGRYDEILSWFDKHGVTCTFRQTDVMKYYKDAWMPDLDKLQNTVFCTHPCFIACTYVDEPGSDHFEVLGKEVEEFKKRFPDKIPYINLLPMYANSAQLKGGAWKSAIEYYKISTDEYREYIDEYVKKVNTDYICVDVYPYQRIPDPTCPERFPAYYIPTEYADYCKNLEIVADACRKSGRDFWGVMQSCSWSKGIREPEPCEIVQQFYTMMSFGATHFEYYVFAHRARHSGCMLDERGHQTKIYWAAKDLADAIYRMEDVYLSYKNVGVFNVNYSEEVKYLALENPYTGFDTIKEIESDTPLLVGCFEKEEGTGHAFTLVNYSPFKAPKTSHVKVKIDGKVTEYVKGEPCVLESNDGYYAFTLEKGQGTLVTVE